MLDTKLKNNRKKKIVISVGVLLILTFLNLCLYPVISFQTADNAERTEEDYEIREDAFENLYHGCYVLYLELKQQGSEERLTASDVFLNEGKENTEATEYLNNWLSSWSADFEPYRYIVDYYATDGETEKKNTERNLKNIITESGGEKNTESLAKQYSQCMVLSFDENGVFSVSVQNDDILPDTLMKMFETIDRHGSLQEIISDQEYYLESEVSLNRIRSFQVVYGIPESAQDEFVYLYQGQYDTLYWFVTERAVWLYLASIAALVVLAFVMTSRKIWKDDISFERKGNWYLMEAACLGILFLMCFYDGYCEMICKMAFGRNIDGGTVTQGLSVAGVFQAAGGMILLEIFLETLVIYAVAYTVILAIRPVYSIGVKEYIRQYSFLYQIFPWMKSQWKKFTEEVGHIDFSEKSTKTIGKIVILNFLVLAVMMCMWMFGIIGLIIYSLVLFYLLRKYYDKIAKDYRVLMDATSRIADGDLDTVITEDIGVFEPFKAELFKIRTGFKKAVEEETKSQRMKTELITNVSHDLKTPLTAMTTYVELLKKEDITEEERRSYIDILDRKTLRLKVLVEDLFEVSKASTDNITLNRMDVDVVNLLKQVSIEHAEKYEAAGIELRWNVPEEKVILSLDNQKTYRIFENLFGNIQKYAMPNSRVYIDVVQENGRVRITVKNMSAVELTVKADELTERFVRGDASRNTEGSGLGLAIAKSFTEAQKGIFEVTVDGDLFKVTITW